MNALAETGYISRDQWQLGVLSYYVLRSSYNAELTAQLMPVEIIGSTMSDWFLGIRYLVLLGMPETGYISRDQWQLGVLSY